MAMAREKCATQPCPNCLGLVKRIAHFIHCHVLQICRQNISKELFRNIMSSQLLSLVASNESWHNAGQVRPSVTFMISEPCTCCHATGRVEALETSFSKIEQEICRLLVSFL